MREATDFQYFTGKNTAKGFLNQAPVQRTRAYDSDIFKDTTVSFTTNRVKSVNKEEDTPPTLDINLADDILALQNFQEFCDSKKYNESVKPKIINNDSDFSVSDIRKAYEAFLTLTDDDSDKVKVSHAYNRYRSSYEGGNPLQLLDWFYFGMERDVQDEIDKKDAPTPEELYNHFQSEKYWLEEMRRYAKAEEIQNKDPKWPYHLLSDESLNILKSEKGIDKYDL